MHITFYGHSCFSVDIGGSTLLFDPFISGNPAAKHIDIKQLKADYILISHGHADHIADAVDLALHTGATVISNYEIIDWLRKKGVNNVHDMNIGGHWFFTFGKVKCVNAIHSSMLPDGSYGGNPMGFLVESSEGNFYYSGDTALTYDMKLIGEYKKMDVVLFPIGGNYTMGVDNAIIAAGFVKCDKVVGLHYNTFAPISIDESEAVAAFANAGKELILIPIGKSVDF